MEADIIQQLFPPLVRDKIRAKNLSVGVHEEVELAQDGQPHIVRPDNQRVVL
jgi:hypothetical protein